MVPSRLDRTHCARGVVQSYGHTATAMVMAGNSGGFCGEMRQWMGAVGMEGNSRCGGLY